MSKRKYKPGRRIRSIADFERSKHKYYIVKFGNIYKTLHYSFLISWQYRTLEKYICMKLVYEAERIEDAETA